MSTPITHEEAQTALESAFGGTPEEAPELEIFMALLRQHQAHFIKEHLADHLDPESEKHTAVRAAYADRFVLETDFESHSIALGELGYDPDVLQEAVAYAHREAAAEHYGEIGDAIDPIVLNLPEWGG